MLCFMLYRNLWMFGDPYKLCPSDPYTQVWIEAGWSCHCPPARDFRMQWSQDLTLYFQVPVLGCTFTYYLICCRACVTVGSVLKESPTVSTWWRKPRALWSTCQLNPTPWAKPLVCWFNTGVLWKVSKCAGGHSLLAFPCHNTLDSGLANFCSWIRKDKRCVSFDDAG